MVVAQVVRKSLELSWKRRTHPQMVVINIFKLPALWNNNREHKQLNIPLTFKGRRDISFPCTLLMPLEASLMKKAEVLRADAVFPL